MKEIVRRLLGATLGAERTDRLVDLARRALFRIRHPVDYRAARRGYDVVFCCDTVRWQNLKLVVEELGRRRPDLRIAVAHKEPPGGIADLAACPGVTAIAHAVLATLPVFKTRLLYLPIPDLPSWLRPRGARAVHGLMSMASMDGIYLDHHFDGFDYVLCGGPHHIDSLRKLAQRRPALAGLVLVPAGYPKLDLMLSSRDAARPGGGAAARTIVYAPTHVIPSNERLASLRRHGESIVATLLEGGHRVIFRPHPISFVDQDAALIERIAALHADNPRFALDRSKDYTRTYACADLMVTDLSGTGFTFSLTFTRPCIFFAPDADAERGLSGVQFHDRERIGAVVRTGAELSSAVEALLGVDFTGRIERFRSEFVFHPGTSAAYIASCLEDMLAGRQRPEWIRL